MRTRPYRAFTLVEILIVVAIVGILVAIAVPAFLKASRLSRATSSQKNMTSISGAVDQYILEFDITDTAAFIAIHGTVVADWDDKGLISGIGNLRTPPTDPLGGQYYMNDWDNNPDLEPIFSSAEPKVYYPGFEPDE